MKTKSICPRCKKLKIIKNRYCRKCIEAKFEIVAISEKNKEPMTKLNNQLKKLGFIGY